MSDTTMRASRSASAVAESVTGASELTGAVRGVVIPISVALLANLWTFAAIALLELPLTLLTGLLAPTLLAIGSIYGVHVLSRYEEEATSHDDPSAAVLASQRHLTMPVCIAGLTTVAGFGALLITDVQRTASFITPHRSPASTRSTAHCK